MELLTPAPEITFNSLFEPESPCGLGYFGGNVLAKKCELQIVDPYSVLSDNDSINDYIDDIDEELGLFKEVPSTGVMIASVVPAAVDDIAEKVDDRDEK